MCRCLPIDRALYIDALSHHLYLVPQSTLCHPISGLDKAMGVTSALQDVVALAKVIDGPETPLAEALLAYERKRRIPAALVQLISRYVGYFIKHVLCG